MYLDDYLEEKRKFEDMLKYVCSLEYLDSDEEDDEDEFPSISDEDVIICFESYQKEMKEMFGKDDFKDISNLFGPLRGRNVIDKRADK